MKERLLACAMGNMRRPPTPPKPGEGNNEMRDFLVPDRRSVLAHATISLWPGLFSLVLQDLYGGFALAELQGWAALVRRQKLEESVVA